MEKINELVEEIKTLTESFMTEATSNLSGNKAAGRRARKTTIELSNLYRRYRNATILAERNKTIV